MAGKQWKAVERAIARLLGGERVPVTGRQRGSAPDIRHDYFAIEVKHRKTLPKWLLEAQDQAEASAREGHGVLPIVIIHRERDQYIDSLVMLRLGEFMEHFGEER